MKSLEHIRFNITKLSDSYEIKFSNRNKDGFPGNCYSIAVKDKNKKDHYGNTCTLLQIDFHSFPGCCGVCCIGNYYVLDHYNAAWRNDRFDETSLEDKKIKDLIQLLINSFKDEYTCFLFTNYPNNWYTELFKSLGFTKLTEFKNKNTDNKLETLQLIV